MKEILLFKESSYDITTVSGTLQCFKTSVDCKLKTDEDVKNFVEEYTKKTNETFTQAFNSSVSFALFLKLLRKSESEAGIAVFVAIFVFPCCADSAIKITGSILIIRTIKFLIIRTANL